MKTLVCEFHKFIPKIIIDEERNIVEFFTNSVNGIHRNYKIDDQAHIELIVAVLIGEISATTAHQELTHYINNTHNLDLFEVKEKYPAGFMLQTMIILDKQRFIDEATEEKLWSYIAIRSNIERLQKIFPNKKFLTEELRETINKKLLNAVKELNKELVRQYLTEGADINFINSEGFTVFSNFIRDVDFKDVRALSILTLLLQNGINYKITDLYGKNTLDYLNALPEQSFRNEEAKQQIRNYILSFSIKEMPEHFIMIKAPVKNEDSVAFAKLISEGDIKTQLMSPPSPNFGFFKNNGDLEVRLTLNQLNQGNTLNFNQVPRTQLEIQQEKNENLFRAVKTFKEEEVLIYLKEGANPNYVGDNGLTSPLVHLVRDSVPEGPNAMRIIKLLLQFGADPFMTYGYNNNMSGWNCIQAKPAHKISDSNRQVIVQLFLECPANVKNKTTSMML